MVEDEPEGLNQDLDVDSSGKIVEEAGKINELPKYKSREEAVAALKKEPEITYANDNHKWVEIEIPDSGVIGEKYKIKVSKKVPKLEFALAADIRFEKLDKLWRPNEPAVLFGRAFRIEKLTNTDEFEGVWEEIATTAGKKFNSLPAGDYLFEVQANGRESWQQTTVRRIIKVVKKDEN